MIWQKSKSHLSCTGESYFGHLRFALAYAFSCLQAACMAAVHGFIPALFTTGASDKVKSLATKPRANLTHSMERLS
jgi:hypothetical protein